MFLTFQFNYSNIRQMFVKFYQNLFYIQFLDQKVQQFSYMFSGPSPAFSSIPTSPDAYKIVDAIRDQTNGVPAHLVFVIDIVSVRFGGYFTPQIKAQMQKFVNLQMLTLNDCGIKSLQNFPHLPGLIRLDLVFNQITGQSLNSIRGSRHLQTIMLGANKIEKFQHLEQIGNLKQLLQLDLINNPVSKLPGYREKMFSIFPSISILDTLDKSGKDAYAGSSMALAVARVPDALFDKSPSVPFIPPVTVPPASVPSKVSVTPSVPPARTTSISKPTPLVTTTSKRSMKADPVIKANKDDKKVSKTNSKSGKLGKTGKLGKAATGTKSRSASARAGLNFPVGRIKRRLKQRLPSMRVSKGTSVYLSAVLEYLTAQVLQIAGNATKQQKKRKITPALIKRSLKSDEQLHKLLNDVTFSM